MTVEIKILEAILELTSVSKKSGQTTVVIQYYSLSRFFWSRRKIKYFSTYQAWVEQIFNKQTKITIFFAFISVMIVDILAFKIGLSSEKPFNLVCSAAQRCSGQVRARLYCARARSLGRSTARRSNTKEWSIIEQKNSVVVVFFYLFRINVKDKYQTKKNKSNDYFKWKVF